ncbi:MAG: GH36-type glycosyl hydrolase domain-containing protein [Bacillota bacterium]
MNSKLTLNRNGQFHITDVTNLSYTYFPMCNGAAIKSSISPNLGGDATVDQNSFLLVPSTAEDLKHSLMKRHVFFRINDEFTWSTTGQTPTQILTPDRVDLYGDFLVHKIVRHHAHFTCIIESFVPTHHTYQELHKITIKNTQKRPLKVKPVIGIPLYGRSADVIRDHRHVTSLLNRITIIDGGVINHPTFSFDERGHLINHRHYGVVSHSSRHERVKRYHPILESFTGEIDTLLDPIVVKNDIPSPHHIGDVIAGYEAIAGMEYDAINLEEHEELTLTLSLIISDDIETFHDTATTLNAHTFDAFKRKNKATWKTNLSSLEFNFPDSTLNGWLKWVSLQPTLRRIYGNSFMPHHDYGRGGKGWRDLWQDLLALILMNPRPVRTMLLNNFKGVRIDGSNATIIGDKPGMFLADRNNITRIWMDHGAWPLLTTKLYIDQSGDIEVLFETVGYFQDQFTHYTKSKNASLSLKDPQLKTHKGDYYQGTVLEHIIIQNVVPYYNVGKHNAIRLEDADWNDGLDMAKEHGESVAFTSFYGYNLMTIALMIETLDDKGIKTIELCEELNTLLYNDIQYPNIKAKHAILDKYFHAVEHGVTGNKVTHQNQELASALRRLGTGLITHVRNNEWAEDKDDGWFNGYYDNDGQPLDDVAKKHMTLTGQVFSIMSHAATDYHVKKIIKSADKYLYNDAVGGYRLNTDFKEVKPNMGRLFGFAYGHKENGAMFSHMALMYANALYKRGFVKAGYKVIKTIYTHSIDINQSKIYPGLPEYFDPKGRGMYAYLTGSASWLILTMVTEMFGVKSAFGLPLFEPKLLHEQFENQNALTLKTIIGDHPVEVVYQNPLNLTYGEYIIKDVLVNQASIPFSKTHDGVKLHEPLNANKVIIVLGTKTSE